ncbi:MAG: type I restriction endonuclease subunit R [Bacteroidales bacterium]|nr:type I restriction endonuclease subunit R [Bacteroidales bacterium]
MANRRNFNENTRVQVPAAMHLVRLGYKYLSNIGEFDYDPNTNLLTKIFLRSLKNLNPEMDAFELDRTYDDLLRTLDNEDLGREFFQKITATSGVKYIDFEHPEKNQWHVTTEFTCENQKTHDNFRPDLTVFINGLPLAFIEVKKPFNREGIMAERNRIDTRMRNKAFLRFFNATQFMIFSNNEEYNTDSQVPISGAFYSTISSKKAFFNVFREEDKDLLQKSGYKPAVADEVEHEILIHRNCPQLKALPEYQTNQHPDTPTNRIITSMLSRERFLFILRYGIAYVNQTIELEGGQKVTELQKHIMRYQQLFATYAIRKGLDKGITGGIVWHTQGSGKTALSYYNVKSLTDYFAKKNTPVKFYFVVDRLDLLEQASSEFAMRGLIVRQAQSREELMADFHDNTVRHNAEGKPEIMVVNIQKFATDHQRISKKEVYSTNLRRIFFIDEAHRGYSPEGSFLANLFEADQQAIKIALTGTPLIKSERESWRVFGDYIHTYYYDKSISDGYTLKLMREDIETVYKEEITAILDRLTSEVKVKKNDIEHNTIIEHDSYLRPVLRYILRDIKRSRIQQDSPHMAGMIVCETNPQAREVFRLLQEEYDTLQEKPTITKYIEMDPQPFGNVAESVAMYGRKPDLRSVLILHDEGDKLERKGSIEEFKKTENIDFLIVNAMLLTGFDAPRLKKLYLMRKLDGHNLLQALTRVNRPYRDFKYGYVVDFANIKENFVETNNMYMRELNRTNERSEDGDILTGDGAGNALMVSNEEILQKMRDIKSTLFQYATENAEEFSRQIEEISDKEQLYRLRHALEEAKALSNQVRSFGDDELKERFDTMEIDSVPSLISEVSHRIQRINLLDSTDHKADVSGIIREALSMLEFEVKKRGNEELQIVYNDLKERYDNVEHEFSLNFDTEEEAYITLSEDFRRYFARKGFTPDTVAEAREDIDYMDAVMEKIKKINRANAVLRAKYKGDEKYVRIHKRVREENERRDQATPKQKPIISHNEMEIANGLNAIKKVVDEQVYLDYGKMLNQGFFDQLVMMNLATQLHRLKVEAVREDRNWLRNRLVSEYLDGYRMGM